MSQSVLKCLLLMHGIWVQISVTHQMFGTAAGTAPVKPPWAPGSLRRCLQNKMAHYWRRHPVTVGLQVSTHGHAHSQKQHMKQTTCPLGKVLRKCIWSGSWRMVGGSLGCGMAGIWRKTGLWRWNHKFGSGDLVCCCFKMHLECWLCWWGGVDCEARLCSSAQEGREIRRTNEIFKGESRWLRESRAQSEDEGIIDLKGMVEETDRAGSALNHWVFLFLFF